MQETSLHVDIQEAARLPHAAGPWQVHGDCITSKHSSSPGGTYEPGKALLIQQPEVAVWLSLFSAKRSVSTKHRQIWLQPQEARSNPMQEFNPQW